MKAFKFIAGISLLVVFNSGILFALNDNYGHANKNRDVQVIKDESAARALPALFLTGLRTWFKKKGTGKSKKRLRSTRPVATRNLVDKNAQQHAQV